MPLILPVNSRLDYEAPLFDTTRGDASITLSEGNARATSSGPAANYGYAFCTVAVAGRVYGEVEVVGTPSGTNSYIGLGDDDTALSGTLAYAFGDSNPGWGWRGDATGFSCTPPAGSFADGDVLQFKLDTHSRSVELAKNNGSYATGATWAAASGDVIWRLAVFWFTGISGSFRLPTVPTYTVPTGYAWVGNLPIY